MTFHRMTGGRKLPPLRPRIVKVVNQLNSKLGLELSSNKREDFIKSLLSYPFHAVDVAHFRKLPKSLSKYEESLPTMNSKTLRAVSQFMQHASFFRTALIDMFIVEIELSILANDGVRHIPKPFLSHIDQVKGYWGDHGDYNQKIDHMIQNVRSGEWKDHFNRYRDKISKSLRFGNDKPAFFPRGRKQEWVNVHAITHVSKQVFGRVKNVTNYSSESRSLNAISLEKIYAAMTIFWNNYFEVKYGVDPGFDIKFIKGRTLSDEQVSPSFQKPEIGF